MKRIKTNYTWTRPTHTKKNSNALITVIALIGSKIRADLDDTTLKYGPVKIKILLLWRRMIALFINFFETGHKPAIIPPSYLKKEENNICG